MYPDMPSSTEDSAAMDGAATRPTPEVEPVAEAEADGGRGAEAWREPIDVRPRPTQPVATEPTATEPTATEPDFAAPEQVAPNGTAPELARPAMQEQAEPVDSEALRDRWQELQLKFVDDPQAAAADAARLADEAVSNFTSAIGTRKSQLEASVAGSQVDTEQLRVAMQGFRELVDRVAGH